jgi:hypothetical protein
MYKRVFFLKSIRVSVGMSVKISGLQDFKVADIDSGLVAWF